MNQAEVRRRQAQAVSTVLALITLMAAARLAGYNGAAYVAAAVEIYALVCIVVSGGVSNVLGRILRLRGAKGQYRNAAVMRRNALILQAAAGFLGTAVLFLWAEEIAVGLLKTQYSSAILMILAPAVLLRSLSSLLAGYSRGAGIELPVAAVEILRQVFIFAFSMIFSKMLGTYGGKVSRLLAHENFTSMYGGIGIAIAVTLSEALAALFLLLIYRISKRSERRNFQEGMRVTDSLFDSIRIISVNRGAQAGMLLLAVLSAPLGMMFWQKAGSSSDAAALEYGLYLAGYGAVCGIAVGLVWLSLLPMCANTVNLLRKEESRFARNMFQSGVHVGVVQGAFWAVFAIVMSEQLGAVFGGEQAALAAKMFRDGGIIVLPLALSLYFARLLILTGKKYIVMGAAAAADLVYIVMVTVLLGTGKTGSLSLVYGGLMAGGILCILLGVFTYRVFRQRMDWLYVLAVPAGAAGVAGFTAMLLGKVLTPHLGNPVTVILCLAVAGALYWTGLLLFRNFREQELEVVPGGKLLIALGQLLRVL